MRYAITGSIGTGKSTVCDILKQMGYKVYDADKIVHELYKEPAIISHIAFMFPDVVVNNKIDNKKLANIIFNDEYKKHELENYIHPLVKEKMLKMNDCFIEVPLLFESKMENIFDKVITVYCDLDIQVNRIIQRNNIKEVDALKIIRNQMDIKEKVKRSDFVIDNNGDINNVIKQVSDILLKL